MAWANLATNQGVSFNDLQDAVNTSALLPTGNSISSSNQLVQKSQVNFYVENDTTNTSYVSASNNKILVKSNITPITVFSLTYNASSASIACATASLTNYYSSYGATLTGGTILYNDPYLTTFSSNGFYSNGTNFAIIDGSGGSGSIVGTNTCASQTTTTTTTTLPPFSISNSAVICSGTTGAWTTTATNGTFVYIAYGSSAPNAASNLASGTNRFSASGTTYNWSGIANGTYYIAASSSAATTTVNNTPVVVNCTTTTTTSTTTTTTTLAPVALSLGYNSSSALTACGASQTTYYVANGYTLTTAPFIYTNSSLTSPVSNGFYSDGTNFAIVTGGNGSVTGTNTCASQTTTTTTSTTTTTTTLAGSTITLQARIAGSGGTPVAKVAWSINGGSTWNVQGAQTISELGSYGTYGTISIPNGDTLLIAVLNSSSANVTFGVGNGGSYTGYCGESSYYTFGTVSGPATIYLNIKDNGSGVLTTC